MTSENISVKLRVENRITGDSDIAWLLGQINTLLLHCRDRELIGSPVTAEGLWFLIIVLMLEENATPGEVSKWMVRKHNSVSGMLKRLEEKGYVERHRSKEPGSKRQVKIKLTKDGDHVVDTAPKFTTLLRILSHLSAEDKQIFRRLLFKIRELAIEEARVFEEPPFPSPGETQKTS